MASTNIYIVGTIPGAATEEAWTTPALLNNWVLFDNTWHTPGFYKKGDRVHLRGFIKNGTVASDATGNIFILPVGYRPLKRLMSSVISGSNTLGRLDISPDGSVRAISGSSVWFQLDNVSFRLT